MKRIIYSTALGIGLLGLGGCSKNLPECDDSSVKNTVAILYSKTNNAKAKTNNIALKFVLNNINGADKYYSDKSYESIFQVASDVRFISGVLKDGDYRIRRNYLVKNKEEMIETKEILQNKVIPF